MALYFWITLGSGLGGLARFALSNLVAQHFGENFPWGTLIVNVLGSFVIGFYATLASHGDGFLGGSNTRHFVMTGVLGGFTTFSSFSLQTFSLARSGQWLQAGGNAVGSLVLCLVAVWLGYLAALALSSCWKGS